ncbi:MAG: SIMPL domain-containing protein [Puniceicoccaceae bacterium]
MKAKVIILCCSVLALFNSITVAAPDFPHINVRGFASIEVEPNVAEVNFWIEVTGKNSDEVVPKAEKRSVAVVRLLNEYEIDNDDIEAFHLDKNPMREGGKYGTGKITGYEVTRQIKVTIRNIRVFSNLVQDLLEMDNVVNIDADFSIAEIESVRKSLLREASKNAKEVAKELAEGFDANLGEVYAISKDRSILNHNPISYLTAERGYMASPPHKTIFLPNTITVGSEVYAIFRIIED